MHLESGGTAPPGLRNLKALSLRIGTTITGSKFSPIPDRCHRHLPLFRATVEHPPPPPPPHLLRPIVFETVGFIVQIINVHFYWVVTMVASVRFFCIAETFTDLIVHRNFRVQAEKLSADGRINAFGSTTHRPTHFEAPQIYSLR